MICVDCLPSESSERGRIRNGFSESHVTNFIDTNKLRTNDRAEAVLANTSTTVFC